MNTEHNILFHPKEDSLRMLYNFKDEVSNILLEEENELTNFKKSFKFFI